MKKVLAISSVLLGVVFLAGCGQQPVSQTQPTTSAPVATQPPINQNQQIIQPTTGQVTQPDTTNLNNETASWKTYTNSKSGFEVKYPNTWKVSENDNQINLMPIGGQDVSLMFFVYNVPLNDAELLLPLFSVPGRNVDSRTDVNINGINWVKLIVEENQIAQLTYHNGKTYAAQYSIFENISPEIMSTLKFTK